MFIGKVPKIYKDTCHKLYLCNSLTFVVMIQVVDDELEILTVQTGSV